GILFVAIAKGNRNLQTSSIKDISEIENLNLNASSTYTIKPGDDLWTISENLYKDGFKWTEIAKINNLENPGLIYAGNKLVLPKIIQEKQVAINTQPSLEISAKVIQNNSITVNTYVVVSGDNLWNIAVRAYGDGFKWREIAEANDLKNPSLIHPGNNFKIPR
ncbi:MAG: LysM peptidoglycan-binding domain-containing protein, partial [Candidatus Levybacteria bacterium]|nr:LysM peptidoglycan-binding domain-containing protein [Candidatus Levybacteria bacterium]